MKELKIFALAIFLSVVPIAAFSAELTDQVISDVYVDDAGNLAFGVRVMGDIERDAEAMLVEGKTHRPGHIVKPTIDQLKYLCVWAIGNNTVNHLRFRYEGVGADQAAKDIDKQSKLSLLLLSRMRHDKIDITYSPLGECMGADKTQCSCAVSGLAVAASITLTP